MAAATDPTGALRIRTLADALGIGLEMLDLFAADGDCCAIWLGGPDGEERDFLLCTDERGRDVERLLRYGGLGAALLEGVTGAVLWRTVDDITDGWALTDAFFDHRAELASSGLTLLDEIALCGDQLRSMAVTSFSDVEGWDDVTSEVARRHDGDAAWPPWG